MEINFVCTYTPEKLTNISLFFMFLKLAQIFSDNLHIYCIHASSFSWKVM